MTYKVYFIFLLLAIPCGGECQQEDHVWYFNSFDIDDCDKYIRPEECGASVLDFNDLPPKGYKLEGATLDVIECNASICNADGELILYSNGQAIHDTRHRPIVRGERINDSPRWDAFTWSDENGDRQPSGFRIPQGMAFVPLPESDRILALYHNFEPIDHMELWMGELLELPGAWALTYKDSLIHDHIGRPGAITACRHANGRDWWILQFSEDRVYHYLIDPDGLHLDHQSRLPSELHRSVGQAKFSPQGDKFALYGMWDFSGPDTIYKELLVADFDRCSGELIDPRIYYTTSPWTYISEAVEFSPSGELLYLADYTTIHQYDLTAPDLMASEMLVADFDGKKCFDIGVEEAFGQLQRAPDNKIYVSRFHQCYDIHVIHAPDVRGEGCMVDQHAVKLPTLTWETIPNFNTYRLGPLDGSSCDTLGIDNDPVSRFWYEQDSMDAFAVQFWDVSYFRPETWEWDLGDGTSSTDRHPQHQYADKGIYEVCLTVSNENSSHTSCQEINLGMVSAITPEAQVEVNVFPNPTTDWLRLTLYDYVPQSGMLRLYDMSGQLKHTQPIRQGVNKLDLTAYDYGTYVYELSDQGMVIKTGKVVKVE